MPQEVMYSKKLFNKYILARLKDKDWSYYKLAKELGLNPSNLTRSLDDTNNNNFTLEQFANIVGLLELTPEQVYHFLSGKKKKEATLQQVSSTAKKIIDDFVKTGDGKYK